MEPEVFEGKGSKSFAELWAESRARHARFLARPWVYRAPVYVWYWMWRNLRYSELRYRVKRCYWYFVRGYRGWAPNDVWGFDSYLAGVLAGGLRELADHHHGCPQDMFDEAAAPNECHKWEAWLREKAEWFDWYYRDEDGTTGDTNWIDDDLSEDERSRRIEAHRKKMDHFLTVVLPDFIKYWPNLWD